MTTPDSLVRARTALQHLRDCLQSAHFAARLLEAEIPPPPSDRLSDLIHSVRKAAESARVALDTSSSPPP